MVATPSTMVPLGTPAPGFALPDTAGRMVALADYADRSALLVMFICNHCPYVRHVEAELARLGRDLEGRGVGIVAISSNDAGRYPEDDPAHLAEQAARAGFTFPYLHDESQDVARAYRAACTPDFFLYDAGRRLVYRGQLDGARPANDIPVTGRDLRAAIDAVLAGRAVPGEQLPSVGCSLKWRPGTEPAPVPLG